MDGYALSSESAVVVIMSSTVSKILDDAAASWQYGVHGPASWTGEDDCELRSW